MTTEADQRTDELRKIVREELRQRDAELARAERVQQDEDLARRLEEAWKRRWG
jgi:hypothetical protein